MRFVETPIFTKVITALLDDESYRSLQSALMRRPDQGPTIGGTHGARKAMGTAGRWEAWRTSSDLLLGGP